MKICTKCGNAGRFNKDSQKKDGLCSHCVVCVKARVDSYRRDNLTQIRQKDRERRYAKYLKNKKKHDESNRTWQKANPEKVKIHRTKTRFKSGLLKYGWTPEQFAGILLLQDYKCSICGTPILTRKAQHIDHCHKTKKTRGVLCAKCNRGLGHFGDDPKLLLVAVSYLRGYHELHQRTN